MSICNYDESNPRTISFVLDSSKEVRSLFLVFYNQTRVYTSSYIPSLTIIIQNLCWYNPFLAKNKRRIRFTCPLTMYCVQRLTARQLDRNSMAQNQFHNPYLFFCWSVKFQNSKPLQKIFIKYFLTRVEAAVIFS